jgi:hypothetical protein
LHRILLLVILGIKSRHAWKEIKRYLMHLGSIKICHLKDASDND